MTYRRGGPGTYPEQNDFPPATTAHKGLMPKLGAASATLGGFVVTGGGGPGSAINTGLATATLAGDMTPAQFNQLVASLLDTVAAGGNAAGANWSVAIAGRVATFTLNRVTGAADGAMSAGDKTVLDTRTSARTASALAQRDASGDLLCGGWTSVAGSFAANWSDKGGYQAVQYRLGIDKTVHIRGVATKSTALVAGETIFTLPAGSRPPAQLSRPISSANGATPVLAFCVILTNGTVTVYGGDKDHVSVDGLTFYLD